MLVGFAVSALCITLEVKGATGLDSMHPDWSSVDMNCFEPFSDELSTLQTLVDFEQRDKQQEIRSSATTADHEIVGASWNFNVVAVQVLLLLLLTAFREIGLSSGWFGKQKVRAEHRFYLKCLEAQRTIVASIDFAFIIPLSYNLSHSFGAPDIGSGFIVSAFAAGVVLGVLWKLHHQAEYEMRRKLIVLSCGFIALLEAFLGITMQDTPAQGTAGLTAFIMIVRVLAGMVAGYGFVFQEVILDVCSTPERKQLEAFLQVCPFVGIALGLLIASLLVTPVFPPNPFQSSSYPFFATAELWILMSVSLSCLLPMNIEQASYLNDEISTADEPRTNSLDILDQEASILLDRKRSGLTLQAALQVALCSMMVVGALLGTSYFQQVQYGWSAVCIGLSMFAVFSATCFVLLVAKALSLHLGKAADKITGTVYSIVLVIGTILYFNFATTDNVFLYFNFTTTDNVLLFVGDGLMYPCILTITGMMLSYALWSSNSEKWHSDTNILLGAYLLGALVTFLGGGFIRGIIGNFGRTPYAILQLVLACISLVNFVVARFYSMRPEELPAEICQKLHEVFEQFDTSGSGRLSKFDLINMCRRQDVADVFALSGHARPEGFSHEIRDSICQAIHRHAGSDMAWDQFQLLCTFSYYMALKASQETQAKTLADSTFDSPSEPRSL